MQTELLLTDGQATQREIVHAHSCELVCGEPVGQGNLITAGHNVLSIGS